MQHENAYSEKVLCVQRKQCQLLARHLDERIFQSNALKGVGIASVDGCNERSTMHSWHPEKKRRMPPPCLASKTDGFLDSAEGCKHKPQAADKQASVLWAAYCLYLQTSAAEFENIQKNLDLASLPCLSNRWLWIGAPQLSQVRFKDSQSAGVSSWTTAEWNPVKVHTLKDTSQQWSKKHKNIFQMKRHIYSSWFPGRGFLRSEKTHKKSS